MPATATRPTKKKSAAARSNGLRTFPIDVPESAITELVAWRDGVVIAKCTPAPREGWRCATIHDGIAIDRVDQVDTLDDVFAWLRAQGVTKARVVGRADMEIPAPAGS